MLSTLGLTVIIVLYVGIGLMTVVGSVTLSQRFFPGRSEQIFYAFFLMAIAGFYLAFLAWFDDWDAAAIELAAIAVISLLGLFGTRTVTMLCTGYVLHGCWDMLHEIRGLTGAGVEWIGPLTAIPLAYGYFCLAFDLAIPVYFLSRRGAWTSSQGAT